jgi:hypothetical protein
MFKKGSGRCRFSKFNISCHEKGLLFAIFLSYEDLRFCMNDQDVYLNMERRAE